MGEKKGRHKESIDSEKPLILTNTIWQRNRICVFIYEDVDHLSFQSNDQDLEVTCKVTMHMTDFVIEYHQGFEVAG